MRCNFVWPVALITAGVLFLLDEFTQYDWGRTWPIMLIAIGSALVISRNMQPADAGCCLPEQASPAPSSQTSSTDKVNHV
jgi:hypothetical protein